MSDNCTFLHWDSEHWGFGVARFGGDKLTKESAERTLRWCEEEKIRCLYFAASGSCSETLKNAANYGFHFVDVRVDMEVVPTHAPPEAPSGFFCRAAGAEDLAALEKFARVAHHDTRFFKDANFDKAKAAELYALWIARDLREQTVFAAISPGQSDSVVGYLSVNEADGRIGLVAVSPEARGRGIGRHLVASAVAWLRSRGLERVRVATQGTNVPALRLYEICGFRVADVKVWFHRWFDPSDREL
jgi:dTDP-4-amino-4,6-dideoxy-D-galactose acyltransferase